MNKLNPTRSFVLLLILAVSLFALIPVPIEAQPPQRGPKIDRIRLKVTRSPDAQVLAMIAREIDVLNGMIRPGDVTTLSDEGKVISSTSGFHLCNYIYNIRPILEKGPQAGQKNPLHDVNFRHALAHLINKPAIMGSLFQFINIKLDTMVPPSMSEWHETEVDDHPFSPTEAINILTSAGYYAPDDPDNPNPGQWSDPEGLTLTPVRMYVPLESVAPTSYKVGELWQLEMQAIGLTNVLLEPAEFMPYIVKMYDEHDFEIGWTCFLMGRFPDYLYDFFHSSENYLGSDNPSGIYWPALDVYLETLKSGLDHTEKVTAAKEAQKLIAGGTKSNPLGYNIPDDNHWNWSLARLPVYNRNYYDAAQPELAGLVNARGWGTDILPNQWAAMNMHWSVDPATIGRVDPDGKTFVIVNVDEYPERMNPLWSKTVYAAIFYAPYESLIDVNPWTHTDTPWIAKDWEFVNITGEPGYQPGEQMTVKFWLRDDVTWQTGEPFTIDDVKFSWEFLRDWKIPNYWYFAKYINRVLLDYDENSVTAVMNRTSQWDFYDLAGSAFLHRKVWEKNPETGNPWASSAEILGFDPARVWDTIPGDPYYKPNATAANNNIPLTYLYGTGPFISRGYSAIVGAGDLDANRDYWLATTEIKDHISYLFWRAGDATGDGEIWVEDLALISSPGVWGQKFDKLSVNGFSGSTWHYIGTPPYLDARDYPLNYIWSNGPDGNTSGNFTFEDAYTPPAKGVQKVKLSIRIRRIPVDDNSFLEVQVYKNTTGTWETHAIANLHAGWRDRKIVLYNDPVNGDPHQAPNPSDWNDPVNINNIKVRFVYKAGTTPPSTIEIDEMHLEIYDFDFDADLTGALGAPPDGKTDLDDLLTSAKFFGETITTTWPTP